MERWTWKTKMKSRQLPEVPPSELEIAHVESKHRGGTDEVDNLIALSRISHAFQHFQDAKYTSDWETSRKDWKAVQSIVGRMTPSERKAFNYLIQHEQG
jgi:hypothetical protein